MKHDSIHEFADLKGSNRRVVHAPGALASWDRVASQLASAKANAIKRVPVRAYFWYSEIHQNTLVISHYMIKKWSKLRAKDIRRVRENWQGEKAGGRL